MADFILHMPLRFFARVFGNPAGDPVLLKSRGVTLLRDKKVVSFFARKYRNFNIDGVFGLQALNGKL